MSRILFLAALSLACQAGHTSQINNYPFSVESEKLPNSHRLVARNAGPSPVSVRLTISDGQYIQTDRPFPVYVVVPPGGGTLYLGEVKAGMPGVGYSFRTQYNWMMGDLNASQSPDALYRLPYRDGTTFTIGQAPGGHIATHTRPDSTYAVDIPMPEGTPILAAREGTVIYAVADQIYGAQTPDMMDKANEVKILHPDGTIAVYAHLSHGGVFAYPGQRVAAGQQIGLAGSTGYSSGPHLHFAVQTVRRVGDKLETISLPFQFYVGSPPVRFSPQEGMLAKAEYAGMMHIPSMERPSISYGRARQESITPRHSEVPVPLSASPTFLIWFDRMQTKILSAGGLIWLGGCGLVLLILLLRNRRETDRRRGLRIVREPTIGEWRD